MVLREVRVAQSLRDTLRCTGHDYLPKDWPQWIVDPTRRSFVAVDSASGEIAGFESIGDYDSGATKIFQL
eukprot:m.349903 g.349903  ORF g.349903 m.349903 type:complete len:70 (+) comp16578_c0_seq18:2405-2614(+)